MNGVDPYRPVSRAGRSPRARLILATVLALPLLELTGMILVARALGVLVLLGLLIAAATAGTLVLNRVRRAATERFDPHRTVLDPQPAAGQAPAGPAPAQTILLALAGVLLIVPGFLSDAVGLVLLAPPVRRAVCALLSETLLRRLTARTARIVPGEVVPGEVVPGEVVPGTR